MREEFLGGALSSLQSELTGSALVLACYASPTVCDAIKHYRVTANTMLGMELDACRAVEWALDDVHRRTRARAIKECLDEKARQKVPIDAARRLNAAVAEAQSAASADVSRKAEERLAPRRAAEASEAAAGQLAPWGCEVKKKWKERNRP